MRNAQFAFDLDPARRHERAEGGAELAARDQLVVGAAAKSLGGIVAPQQPDRPGLRRFERELCEIGQCANRGVTGAQYGDGLAGIAPAVLPEHVGHAVGDPVRSLFLADGGQTISARRIRRIPGTRCVDDRVGLHDLRTLTILVSNFEGSLFPALGLHLVEANAADAGNAARFLNVRPERGVVGERFEVAFNHLRAGRILIGRGRIPARRRQ